MRAESAREAAIRVAADWRRRWALYGALAIVFALFALFPRPYVARARIMPQDTASAAGTTALMSLLGGQSQNVGSLLGGGRASNDLYLIIGNSEAVSDRVIRQLHLVGPGGYPDLARAKKALGREVDVNLLLGGVMQIEAKTYDPDRSRLLAHAYVQSISKELASFGEQIIVNKARIVQQRFATAAERVTRADAALSEFRRANNLAAPEQQLGSAFTLRASLEAQLQAKLVELRTLEQFNGPENPELKAAQSEIVSLRQQIARAATPSSSLAGPNLSQSSALQARYLNLYRDYRLAQSLYDIYARSSEQVAVDQLSAESASYVQIVDDAYVDADRHYNIWAVAGLSLVLLVMAFVEFYGPLTGLFNLRDLRRREEARA